MIKKVSLFFWMIASIVYPQINVIYPREEMTLSISGGKTFIFGNIKSTYKNIFINGTRPALFPNGTFIGWVDVVADTINVKLHLGFFKIIAFENNDSLKYVRTVQLLPPRKETVKYPLSFDSTFWKPNIEKVYTTGDLIRTTFKGSPGMKASFRLGTQSNEIPMIEKKITDTDYWGEIALGSGVTSTEKEVGGIYEGNYIVQSGDQIDNGKIQYFLRDPAIHLSISAWDSATINITPWQVPFIARIKEEIVNARTGPSFAYHLFLPPGVLAPISGKEGNQIRLKLSASEDIWVHSTQIDTLPLGSPIPRSTITTVRTEPNEKFLRVKIFTQEKLPFKIIQSTSNEPQHLLISIYGATSDNDFIKYETDKPGISKDPFVKELKWYQPERDVYQLRIDLNTKQQWGYNYFYEGNTLVIDIKRPPNISGSLFSSRLKGIKIVIDPGHTPDLGAIGPSGSNEKDTNLEIAYALKKILTKKGAVVLMTHEGEGISLIDRGKKAARWDADIMISIHGNALPDGVNPFENNGTSVYYYHPQSMALAEQVHQSLLTKLKLKNYGLFYDNLAVCRPPQFLAILTEPAFIMYPEEEKLLTDPEFQQKCANAIANGIEKFLKNVKNN